MNTLLLYMIKASFYLATFYVVYALMLSKDTMYRRNRLFVLFSLTASFILPFITLKTATPFNFQSISKILADVFVYGTPADRASANLSETGLTWGQVISSSYFAVVVLFFIKLLIDLGELLLLILRNKNRQNNIIRFQGFNTAGFSAFGYVFVNLRLSDEEVEEVIRHEQNHLARRHSLDIILFELIKVFQWFNPSIYFFGRSLRAIHEYQADEGCLNTGVPLGLYQQLILNQVFRSKIFTITNSFSNPTLIKKRMIMMTKKRSNALANLKILMVLPAIALVLLFISSCSQKNDVTGSKVEMAPPPPPPPPVTGTASSTPFVEVDVMPVFPGGEAGLLTFLAENTRYPETPKTKGIMGKVVVRFAVEADGSVDQVSVLKGVDPDLDKEALRVVSSLPSFEKPAEKDGKKVAVWYAVPINFTLK